MIHAFTQNNANFFVLGHVAVRMRKQARMTPHMPRVAVHYHSSNTRSSISAVKKVECQPVAHIITNVKHAKYCFTLSVPYRHPVATQGTGAPPQLSVGALLNRWRAPETKRKKQCGKYRCTNNTSRNEDSIMAGQTILLCHA